MALPGETINGHTVTYLGCGKLLHIKVLQSAAGYYIGFLCSDCGPYARESGYFGTRKKAEEALAANDFQR